MLKHRGRLLMLSLAVVAVAASAGIFVADEAAASGPSVTGTSELFGSPEAVTCGGTVPVQVTLTGVGGVTGVATDIMLVLDRSGSMGDGFGNGPATTQMVAAARTFVDALDVADGADDGTFGNDNRVGIVTYAGGGTSVFLALTANASDVYDAVDDVPASGASPHAGGIALAATELAGSADGAMIVISDGIGASGTEADAAKGDGIKVASIGVGTGQVVANLQAWAAPRSYQDGSSPIDAGALIGEIEAAVGTPAAFSVVETPGANFSLTGASATAGVVGSAGAAVTWSGTLADGEVATLDLDATRNGDDVFSITEEVVSTTTGDGFASAVAKKIEVLPCDANPAFFEQETCTGTSCEAEVDAAGGLKYRVNAGAAVGKLLIAGLSSTPPPGVCKGFDTKTSGVQIDLRPLTTPGNFEIFIPTAALGSTKWSKTEVCLGTNLPFRTKTGTNAQTGNVALGYQNRYWGLLPSSPREVKITGLGRITGPWVTYRAPAPGGAVIRFTVPYVPGSEAFTSNGLAGYDPRAWGG